MDANRRAAEIEEAISYGIYWGSLPPAPIDDIDTEVPSFFDLESGKPIGLSEVLERGVCGYRGPQRKPVLSFKEALVRFQQDETLDLADREHLERLAADNRMEDHWDSIQRCRPIDTAMAFPGWLIWHVLAARHAAEVVDDHPQRQRHAENAESLAKFLRKKGQTDEPSCQLLEDLARQLRRPEEFTPFNPILIPVSRKSRNTFRGRATVNSRVLKAFINWMSNHLKATYGQPLNEVVATLTDTAFPGRETTIDHVRNAIKPTTKKGRAGKR
jgi:hypothetical protein